MKKASKLVLFSLLLGGLYLPSCRNNNTEVDSSISVNPSVTSISLLTPLKKVYGLGEVIDFESLQFEISYSNGEKSTKGGFDSGMTLTGGDCSSEGNKELKVSYDGFEASFSYQVVTYHLTLNFNGGTIQDKEDDIVLDFYNNRVDISSYLPTLDDEHAFSGWYLDKEASDLACYAHDESYYHEGDITLYAGYDTRYDNKFKYTIDKNDNSVTILSLNFEDDPMIFMEDELVIPATIEGYPVTTLGDKLFWVYDEDFFPEGFNYSSIVAYESLVFEEGSRVTKIGKGAFQGLTNLKKVTFPKTLEIIDDQAFEETGLEGNLVLPGSLKKIGDYAFSYLTGQLESVSFEEDSEIQILGKGCFKNDNYLSSVELPEGLIEIKGEAFEHCGDIKVLELPSTLTNIETDVFKTMDSLRSIEVAPGNKYYTSIDGNLYSKDKSKFIRYCYGKPETTFALNDTVTFIDNSAFNLFNGYSSLKKVVIPEGVKYIGSDAFAGCSFSINLPKSLNSFSLKAFSDFRGDDFHLSEDNATYKEKDGVLYSTNYKTLYALAGGHEFGDFVLEDNVETISDYAFLYVHKINSITIRPSSNLKNVGNAGLPLSSMKSLSYFYYQKDHLPQASLASFYNSQYVKNSSVTIIFDAQTALDEFKALAVDKPLDSFSGYVDLKSKVFDDTIKNLSHIVDFTSYASYEQGIAPKLFTHISLDDSRIKKALHILDFIYDYTSLSEKELTYVSAFEHGIYDSMYYNIKNLDAATSLDLESYFRILNRYDNLPTDIKNSLEDIYHKIVNDFSLITDESNIEALYDEILAFECTSDKFSREEYAKLEKKIDMVALERRTLPTQVSNKLNLLQTSSMIDEVLSNKLKTHEDYADLYNTINSSEKNDYYGLEPFLQGWFSTAKRRENLYHYKEYEAFMKTYDSLMEKEEASLNKALEDFVPSETYDEEKYMKIYNDVILPMSSYPHTVSPEIYAKLYHIFASIDINTFLNSSKSITDDNFMNLYDLSTAIESSLVTSGDPTSVPQYEAYIERRDSLYAYIDSFVDTLKKDILAFSIDKASLAIKYEDIGKRYFGLGDYAKLLLTDENDTTDACQKFYIMTLSYIIYDYFEKVPTLDNSTYSKAKMYLVGYDSFEDFDYHEGAQAYINEYLGLIPEEKRSDIYRYQDYMERLTQFNSAYALNGR